ncbi:MAG: methyltransferase 11 protein [Bacteroidota bacterium]|jgi:ubiquinone/menaquinone biosynthesis C-methylase UbiE|nr:methyltransferase 11 protein [Bacteroidota bacterium]
MTEFKPELNINKRDNKIEFSQELERDFKSYVKLFDLHESDFSKSTLDVGTGSASYPIMLRTKFNNQNAFGVDLFNRLNQDAPDDIKKLHSEIIKISSIEELPFDDESFELVLSKNVIPMFISDKHEFPNGFFYRQNRNITENVQEMLRVCKKGGRVMFDLHNEDSLNQNYEEYKDVGITQEQINAQIVYVQKFREYLESLQDIELEYKNDKSVVVLNKK